MLSSDASYIQFGGDVGSRPTKQMSAAYPQAAAFGSERAHNYCTPSLFNSPFAPSYSMYVVGQEDKAAWNRGRAS